MSSHGGAVAVSDETTVLIRSDADILAARQEGRALATRAGFTGSDLSAHASPPNLGIMSVRYPVTGLAAYRAQLESRGVAIAYTATRVPVGGYGHTAQGSGPDQYGATVGASAAMRASLAAFAASESSSG